MAEEVSGWYRHVVLFGGIFVVGGIAAMALPWLDSPGGATGPVMFQAESPAAAAVAVVLCFGLGTAVAVVVGRQLNPVVGTFVLGAGTAVLALRSTGIVTLALADGSLLLVAFETALWSALVLAATAVVLRFAGPLRDLEPAEGRADRHGLLGLACSLAVIPLVALLARSPLRGQTLAAVTLATMIIGLAARLLAPHVQPRWLFAAPILIGAAGQLFAALTVREPLSDAWIAERLPHLAFARPIDFAAGSLMGISMGLGWAPSFMHRQPDGRADEAGPAPATG